MKYVYPLIFGFVNLLALASFLIGFFTNTKPATIGGGTIVVLADLIAVWGGFLNPFLPTILAIIGAIVIRPWYVGVFWASAIFAILSIPHYLNLLMRPASVVSAGFSKFIAPQNTHSSQRYNCRYVPQSYRPCPGSLGGFCKRGSGEIGGVN